MWKYPELGIDSARRFGLNQDMKQTLLIGLLTLCCACHPVHRPHFNDPPLNSHRDLPPEPPAAVVNPIAKVTPAPRPEPKVEPVEPEHARPDIAELIRVLNGELQDAFFDYDRSDPDAQAVAALRRDADLLRANLPDFPTLTVVIEGHCDERGSAEYNLALGARRAGRAADLLFEFGWPKNQAQTVSYGKEAPQCTDATEACWDSNRRAHLSVRR
jgi:peptidoglycan-associated lipoprotein